MMSASATQGGHKETTGQKYNGLPYCIGDHKNQCRGRNMPKDDAWSAKLNVTVTYNAFNVKVTEAVIEKNVDCLACVE